MSEEHLKECPRCQHILKSYPIQARAFQFYDEVAFYLRCEQCGWETSTTLRVDHFSRPDPESVEEQPHLRLVTPDTEEAVVEDEKPVATPAPPAVQASSRAVAPSAAPRQKRPKRTVPRWHWFAAAIMLIVPPILMVLVLWMFPDKGSSETRAVASLEPAVVVEPANTPVPSVTPPPRVAPPTPPREVPNQTKRRRPELPPEDNWPAPISFDCTQFKTVAERLQCAGRPF